MLVKLVRHTFPDRPDWAVIDESVPLGTVYEVIGYDRDFVIINEELHEIRPVGAFLLLGRSGTGWLPTVCFERVEHGNESSKSHTPIQES